MPDRRAAALALLLTLAPVASRATGLAGQVMSLLHANAARSVHFVEEKRLASLTTPLVSSGTLTFSPPARLEKLTEAPAPERLVIDGDRVSMERNGATRTMSLDDSRALRALAETLRATLAGDLATLRGLYGIEAQGTTASWRLLLTPSGDALRRALARVTLDGSGGDLRQIDIQQAGGDEQRLTLSR